MRKSKKSGQTSLFESISSAEASPAKTFPVQARELAWMVLEAASGTNLLASSASYDRLGWWWRTSHLVRPSGSTTFDSSWKGSAMQAYQSRLRQKISVPRTDEGGSSWSRGEYPTPTASQYGSSNNGNPRDGREEYATRGNPSLQTWAAAWPTATASDSKRGLKDEAQREGGPTLSKVVGKAWPTPLAAAGQQRTTRPRPSELENRRGRTLSAEAIVQWATPTATDRKRSGYGESSRAELADGAETERHMGTTLTDMAVRGHGHPPPVISKDGSGTSPKADLNPHFVVALMGFPRDWLDENGSGD